MNGSRIDMAPNGRIVIPAKIRAELGMTKGGTFVVEVEDGIVKLVPFDLVVRRAQERVRRYIPAGRILSEELIEERRREAELE